MTYSVISWLCMSPISSCRASISRRTWSFCSSSDGQSHICPLSITVGTLWASEKKLQVERHLVNCGYNYTVWDGYFTGHRSTQFMDAISISCTRLVISSTFSTEGGMIKFWYNIPINWSESVFPLLLCVKFWSIIFIKHNFHLSATSTRHLDCNHNNLFLTLKTKLWPLSSFSKFACTYDWLVLDKNDNVVRIISFNLKLG